MAKELKIVSIEPCAIEEFMKTWPCSGLHNVHHVTACFSSDGDLVDYEAYRDEQETEFVDVQDYDGGGAMSALLDDAFKFSHGPNEMNDRKFYISKLMDLLDNPLGRLFKRR